MEGEGGHNKNLGRDVKPHAMKGYITGDYKEMHIFLGYSIYLLMSMLGTYITHFKLHF